MARIAAFAAGFGVLTGLIATGTWLSGLSSVRGYWTAVTFALAFALILDSLIAFWGPKRVFYVSALLSALLAGSDLSGSTSRTDVITLVTIAASCISLVLAIAAARFEPDVSEQSHPMNLPVFG